MLTLPETYCTLISRFARIFSQRVWRHAQVLLIGAILAPGKRTVTSALRVMGLSDEQHFENYHRVLSRAVWSSLEASRILLMLLVNTFVPVESHKIISGKVSQSRISQTATQHHLAPSSSRER
jgi:hypothetical protein